MSEFARFCNKCYSFFRDPDLYATHVETCGVAKQTTDDRPQTAAEKKTADGRRQTAAEPKKVAGGRKQTAAEKEKTTDSRRQTTAEENGDSNTTNVDDSLASAADCHLPSAVSAEGGLSSAISADGDTSLPAKAPKFKT